MYSFKNDYSEGAHPNILKAMIDSNLEQTAGYSEDCYTLKAQENIKKELGREDVDIHIMVGGTQVNLTAISAFLKPYEAVIAVESGHIATHETGAIEATGHKVIVSPGKDGKLTVKDIQTVMQTHQSEHMVKPKMVYISNSTEIGTIYTKNELIALKEVCQQYNLIFYMDGARLGSALCAQGNDLTMKDIATLVDVFYIGGTKNGALMGEALVIIAESLKEDFRYHIKQKGGLMAKGRILGIQFLELFTNNLFYTLAEHENQMATQLQEGIKRLGYDFMIETTSNQIFPIFPNEVIAHLEKKYSFMIWQLMSDSTKAIRLVTSWATSKEAVAQFISDLESYSK